MADKQRDALAIADLVHPLDVHDRVGEMNAIVKADFKSETPEDGTGNPFKQAQYDGAKVLEPYTKAVDKVEVLQGAAKILSERAIADGQDWVERDLSDFSMQIVTTFLDEEEDDDFDPE